MNHFYWKIILWIEGQTITIGDACRPLTGGQVVPINNIGGGPFDGGGNMPPINSGGAPPGGDGSGPLRDQNSRPYITRLAWSWIGPT